MVETEGAAVYLVHALLLRQLALLTLAWKRWDGWDFLQGPWALVIPMTETVYSSGGFAIVSREPLAEAASGRSRIQRCKKEGSASF